MILFMAILTLLVYVLLVLLSAVVPSVHGLSAFELDRRVQLGEVAAVAELRREKLLARVLSLLHAGRMALLTIFIMLCALAFGLLVGFVVAILGAIEYGVIARQSVIRRQAQAMYDRYEAHLFDFVERHPTFLRVIRSVSVETPREPALTSREELEHLIAESKGLLSTDEKNLIKHSLEFPHRLVSEVMTPKSVIDSIKKEELLGPLVLDDLHKTGHSRFPVIEADIDHIVGILHVQDMMTLDNKHSVTAEQAMESRVFYIKQDQSLDHALAAFLKSHHHLFVVVNEFQETVGLLSLEDTIEALLGRKIIDEFDLHDDLRAVARRNPRSNNHPQKRQDV
jgi:CBS domain containing-hemolysin-like protein